MRRLPLLILLELFLPLMRRLYPNPAKPEPNRRRKVPAVSSQQSEDLNHSVGRRSGNVIIMPEWD